MKDGRMRKILGLLALSLAFATSSLAGHILLQDLREDCFVKTPPRDERDGWLYPVFKQVGLATYEESSTAYHAREAQLVQEFCSTEEQVDPANPHVKSVCRGGAIGSFGREKLKDPDSLFGYWINELHCRKERVCEVDGRELAAYEDAVNRFYEDGPGYRPASGLRAYIPARCLANPPPMAAQQPSR
jgi:hypothetical protein